MLCNLINLIELGMPNVKLNYSQMEYTVIQVEIIFTT